MRKKTYFFLYTLFVTYYKSKQAQSYWLYSFFISNVVSRARKEIAKPIKTNIKSSKSSSFPCYLDRIISTTPARRSKYNLDCGEVKLNVTLAIYKTP